MRAEAGGVAGAALRVIAYAGLAVHRSARAPPVLYYVHSATASAPRLGLMRAARARGWRPALHARCACAVDEGAARCACRAAAVRLFVRRRGARDAAHVRLERCGRRSDG